jgi:DoxX-like family
MPGPAKEQENKERSKKVFTAYVITAVFTIVANTWAAVADLASARFVLANMDEVGVPRSWLAPLGVLKGAGAAGRSSYPAPIIQPNFRICG